MSRNKDHFGKGKGQHEDGVNREPEEEHRVSTAGTQWRFLVLGVGLFPQLQTVLLIGFALGL